MADRSRCFDRRSFLLALPALAVGAGSVSSCRRRGDRHSALAPLVAELEPPGGSSSFAGRSLAMVRAGEGRVVGSQYREGGAADDAIRDRLAQELLAGFDWRGGPAAVRRVLDGQVQADYEEGRTVQINGWIFSETEVRLLAYRAIADVSS